MISEHKQIYTNKQWH